MLHFLFRFIEGYTKHVASTGKIISVVFPVNICFFLFVYLLRRDKVFWFYFLHHDSQYQKYNVIRLGSNKWDELHENVMR